MDKGDDFDKPIKKPPTGTPPTPSPPCSTCSPHSPDRTEKNHSYCTALYAATSTTELSIGSTTATILSRDANLRKRYGYVYACHLRTARSATDEAQHAKQTVKRGWPTTPPPKPPKKSWLTTISYGNWRLSPEFMEKDVKGTKSGKGGNKESKKVTKKDYKKDGLAAKQEEKSERMRTVKPS